MGTAAIGTKSTRKGGTATVSMGFSTAALVGVLEQAMSSSSSVARISRFCPADQLQRRQRLHRLQRRRRLQLRLQRRPPHPHLLPVAASGQAIAVEAVQLGGAAKASLIAVVA